MHVMTTDARRRWMSALAKAPLARLEAAYAALVPAPAYECLRTPETGLVMVRGRAGGVGQRFNLGELAVTRCAVRLADGATGHAYVAGRDRRKAELAAVFDALLQGSNHAEGLTRDLIEPLIQAEAEAKRLASRKAAATKVEFFTLARGED